LAPLARLFITAFLQTVVRAGLSNRRVQFLLDEAAGLSHLEILDDAIDKFRSYGIRLTLIYQSLSQLKLCFPDGRDQTVLGACTQVYFAVNDYPTAEYISNRLGDFTQVITSGGTNESTSHQGGDKPSTRSTSYGSNSSWQQGARRLLQASEVLQLDNRVAITFHPGVPPIISRLVRYYEKGWNTGNSIGFFKVVFDTLCLFGATLMPAMLVTALLMSGTFK
jgi:type IV secretion system protein VirD4